MSLLLSCIDFTKYLSFITETLKTFGLTRGLFVVFFLGMHIWVYCLYKGRLDDRQREIDRMANEYRELREFFMNKLRENI